jgi:hypothetical protein
MEVSEVVESNMQPKAGEWMGDLSYVDYVTGRRSSLFRVAYLLTGAQEPAEDLLQSV